MRRAKVDVAALDAEVDLLQLEASVVETLFISTHAIRRYRERVDPIAASASVVRAIREIVISGRSRSRPRRWTTVKTRPGCRYMYLAVRPDICVVVRGDVVVTVFSRQVCRAWRAELCWELIAGSGSPQRLQHDVVRRTERCRYRNTHRQPGGRSKFIYGNDRSGSQSDD
jgi:hypothetical protein